MGCLVCPIDLWDSKFLLHSCVLRLLNICEVWSMIRMLYVPHTSLHTTYSYLCVTYNTWSHCLLSWKIKVVRRENFPYHKRDVLQSCQSPLVFLELKVKLLLPAVGLFSWALSYLLEAFPVDLLQDQAVTTRLSSCTGHYQFWHLHRSSHGPRATSVGEACVISWHQQSSRKV